jgi:hypothetical protein
LIIISGDRKPLVDVASTVEINGCGIESTQENNAGEEGVKLGMLKRKKYLHCD